MILRRILLAVGALFMVGALSACVCWDGDGGHGGHHGGYHGHHH